MQKREAEEKATLKRAVGASAIGDVVYTARRGGEMAKRPVAVASGALLRRRLVSSVQPAHDRRLWAAVVRLPWLLSLRAPP